jgi:hypothetical protein
LCFVRIHRGVPIKREMIKNEKIGYDLYSAVTFLLIGLGLGTVFAVVFNPNTKQRVRQERINRRRAPGVEPQEEAKERVA